MHERGKESKILSKRGKERETCSKRERERDKVREKERERASEREIEREEKRMRERNMLWKLRYSVRDPSIMQKVISFHHAKGETKKLPNI